MKFKMVQLGYSTNELRIEFESQDDMLFAWDLLKQQGGPDQKKKNMDDEIVRLIRADRFIEAIRYHRFETGSYLVESKRYCDAIRDTLSTEKTSTGQSAAPRSGAPGY